ncbi:hypothetical protein NE237_012131 [Protea cynaroides]|uniref:Uncharacterized protein n=1 Tax=Protea cynaroides TaxID=273540 RepID=A0A9Q0GWY2_9MAGN|nr:hypothetical protein NE237_012131 [Protea cynaroides]
MIVKEKKKQQQQLQQLRPQQNMAEPVVSSVAQYDGGQLIQEGKLLDARQDESEIVRNRVSEIRELAYDVEDAIDTYILKAKNASVFNPKKYIRLHTIGMEISMLQSRIQDITRSVETYGFKTSGQQEGTSTTTEMGQKLRQSYPHYDDEDVTGIDDNLKILVADLINKKGPRLVSIVGMGGLGKTTLAKKEIIMKVSNQMGLEMLDDRVLMEKLFKLLEDKCYLVVLDDIWSEDAWYALQPAFPKGKMGSKIMLTTRNKKVARCADPLGFPHELACLTEEQSWELFCKKAFPWKKIASVSTSSSSLYPSDAEANDKEKLGRCMVKKCGGLPLAIVVLGGLLATKQSIREWETVTKDIGRHLNQPQLQEQYGVWWILSLSYHDLPLYLKPCFLYLGLYPEDTIFHKRELINMWIAEGFVQQSAQATTMEEMGEEYLVELINRSMVQVGERSFRGKVKKCRLHDLMLDLCLQKAKEENFLCIFDAGGSLLVGDSSSTSVVGAISNHRRMRRHAIHFSCDRYVSTQQSMSTRSQHVRALSLWKLSNPKESIVGTLKFVCEEFDFLRVLVLEDIKIDSLPRAMGKLIHLRYLRIIGSKYSAINFPASIGDLRSLQFLSIQWANILPNVVRKMTQLTYFRISSNYINDKPFQVDGLKNLSTLELPVWRIIKYDLSTLPNLRKLFFNGMDGHDCKLLHKLSISKSDLLQCLTLVYDWGLGQYISEDYDWSPLSCCHSLWKLHIEGKLSKLPKLEDFPPNLTKLLLHNVALKESPIPSLEMLPNLESLRLEWVWDNMLITKFYFSAKGFGKLQYLRLGKLSLLEELEVETGALSCLVHLEFRYCFNSGILPEGLRFITSLKKLEVTGMPLPQELNKRIQEDGDDWHKIQHIPSVIIG